MPMFEGRYPHQDSNSNNGERIESGADITSVTTNYNLYKSPVVPILIYECEKWTPLPKQA